jgi:hypothetical protein
MKRYFFFDCIKKKMGLRSRKKDIKPISSNPHKKSRMLTYMDAFLLLLLPSVALVQLLV